MPTPRCRPFNVLDGMILVAATAVGCWSTPPSLPQWFRTLWLIHANPMAAHYETNLVTASVGRLVCETLSRLGLQGMHVWLAWTLACGALRLRRPRLAERRLGRQPGWVASCVVAAMFLVAIGLDKLVLWIARAIPELFIIVDGSDYWMPIGCCLAAPAVVGGWLTLRLGGRWRPEPGWIDRAGRVLGWGWIAAFAFRRLFNIYWLG